jgi:hypothetical protein
MKYNNQMLFYTRVSTLFIGTNLAFSIANFFLNMLRHP